MLTHKSTPDDFIKFFEGIPDDKWCEDTYYLEDKCCAAGHIQKNFGRGCMYRLYFIAPSITVANDNHLPKYKHLPTPRLRVVEYLKDVRDGRSIK